MILNNVKIININNKPVDKIFLDNKLVWEMNKEKKDYVFTPVTIGGIDYFDGKSVWNDLDGNTYSSSASGSYVFDKNTKTWSPKTWGDGIIPVRIWDDGENIYCLGYYIVYVGTEGGGVVHYYNCNRVLDKDTDTWVEKSWNIYVERVFKDNDGNIFALNYYDDEYYMFNRSTDSWSRVTMKEKYLDGRIYDWRFSESSIWTDGENVYSDEYYHHTSEGVGCKTHILKNEGRGIYYWYEQPSNYWKCDDGEVAEISGDCIWKHKGDIYCNRPYSGVSNTEHVHSESYIFDRSTKVWKHWQPTNITDWNMYPDGEYIWTDGVNIYSSHGYSQYVLDKSTSTWNPIVWNSKSYQLPSGDDIWTDGIDFFYSYDLHNNIALDKSTSTWIKTSSSLPRFGRDVWTDGVNIYSSHGYDEQYIFDRSTSTWSRKSWNIINDSFYGEYIWTDGVNIYSSHGYSQYVLDKSTSTWNPKIWSGLTSFYGRYIWTDEDNIYYSEDDNQYVLDKSTSTWNPKIWSGLTSFNRRYIWTDGDNIYYSKDDDQYVLDKSTSTWNPKNWKCKVSIDGADVWTDKFNTYYSTTSILGRGSYILIEKEEEE